MAKRNYYKVPKNMSDEENDAFVSVIFKDIMEMIQQDESAPTTDNDTTGD